MLVLDIDSTSTWNGVLVVFHVLVLFSSFKMASVNTGIDDWRQPRSDSETLLLSVSPYQDSRLLPLQLWLQPSEYYQHTSTRHLLPRGQEGNTHTPNWPESSWICVLLCERALWWGPRARGSCRTFKKNIHISVNKTWKIKSLDVLYFEMVSLKVTTNKIIL